LGIGLLALTTGVLDSWFAEVLAKRKEERMQTICPHCGRRIDEGSGGKIVQAAGILLEICRFSRISGRSSWQRSSGSVWPVATSGDFIAHVLRADEGYRVILICPECGARYDVDRIFLHEDIV